MANELTALTDFVVLGAIPRRPVRRSAPTPEQARQARAQQNLRDAYERTVETAKALSVPVMPQEVFLNFLGYSGRYASR